MGYNKNAFYKPWDLSKGMWVSWNPLQSLTLKPSNAELVAVFGGYAEMKGVVP